MFLVCNTISRFISFCMDVCGRGENLFLCSLGGMDIFVPGHATYEPRLPLHRGYPPLPCCRLPFPGRPPTKNTTARPSLSTARTRFPPAVDPARLHMRRTVPRRTVPPAAALLLATISLNTYLANHEFTYYRSFVVVSGYSASILYPHRSRLRL